ncbi:MAG: two-component system response regulator [Candidatus Hydrothermarchaeales archaeon]
MNDDENLRNSEEEEKITSEGLAEELEEEVEEAEEEVKKPKLVVVDDDKKTRKLIKKAFKKEFDVIDLEEGGECVQVLIEERPALVLLDEDVPGVDGWSIIAKIEDESIYRNEWMKNLPVAMLSDKAPTLELLQRVNIERIVDYITKPFKKEDIQERVNRILKRLSKIERVRDQAQLRSYRVAEEYERISKALYLRQGLIKPIRKELKKKREDGDLEEVLELEKVINDQMAWINFYRKRKKEIEDMAEKWSKTR